MKLQNYGFIQKKNPLMIMDVTLIAQEIVFMETSYLLVSGFKE